MNRNKFIGFFLIVSFIALLITVDATNGFGGNSLKSITITDENNMICDDSVTIYDYKNLTEFFKENSYFCGYVDNANYTGRHQTNCITLFIPLDSMVCSADKLFDGSEKDKKLLSVVKWKVLRRALFVSKTDNRYDIVSYLELARK